MSLLFPEGPAARSLTITNISQSRPILGPELKRLGLRNLGRPRGLPEVEPGGPIPFMGGASGGELFFTERD